jgi:hypothetical protein
MLSLRRPFRVKEAEFNLALIYRRVNESNGALHLVLPKRVLSIKAQGAM